MIVMAALLVFSIWGVTPRSPGDAGHGGGVASDIRDC
jgi:hypothetical protein